MTFHFGTSSFFVKAMAIVLLKLMTLSTVSVSFPKKDEGTKRTLIAVCWLHLLFLNAYS